MYMYELYKRPYLHSELPRLHVWVHPLLFAVMISRTSSNGGHTLGPLPSHSLACLSVCSCEEIVARTFANYGAVWR